MQCKVDDFILSASALSSPCLDLSRKGICELPEEMPGCENLECLYLEGNRLTSLSASLFSSCPNLRWLDLRNNHLTHLPPCIHSLRSLKTLLLQGNRLTSLPPELGQLQELSGLSLASNPLTSPPPHVVQRGTSAVLRYLRDQLARREEEKDRGRGSEGEDEEEGDLKEGLEGRVTPPRPINEAPLITEDPHEQRVCSDPVLPVMLQPHLKPAPLHPHPSPLSPSPSSHLTAARGRRGDGKTTRGERGQEGKEGGGRKLGGTTVHVQPISQEEKMKANTIIERQKSKERLEQWRAGAREDHLRPCPVEPGFSRATDTAPFATEREYRTEHSQTEHRLEANDDHSLTSRFRSSLDEAVHERVQQYSKTLQGQRRQAGLISSPSSELLLAERNLAEALAQRDEIEGRKAREYRLTAFTADPNIL